MENRPGPPFLVCPETGGLSVTHAFAIADYKAFFCPECRSLGNVLCYRSNIYAQVQCMECEKKGVHQAWYVCTPCAFNRGKGPAGGRESTNGHVTGHMFKRVSAHGNRPCHAQSILGVQHYLIKSMQGDHEQMATRKRQNLKRQMDRKRELDDQLHQYFGTPQQQALKEYLQCHLNDGGCGARPLVIRSFDQYGLIEDGWDLEELSWELLSAHVYFGLHRMEREKVVAMVQHYYLRGRKHQQQEQEADSRGFCPTEEYKDIRSQYAESKTSVFVDYRGISPPEGYKDIRSRYVESKTSIAESLPIPNIERNIPGHACLTVTSVLCDFLAHGTNHETIPVQRRLAPGAPYDWITETPRADEIRRTLNIQQNFLPGTLQPCILPYIIWNDDFEGNNSTKVRGSTWLQTITVAPHRRQPNLKLQTYPLAIGKSGDGNHTPAEELLLEHMQKWMKSPTDMFSLKEKSPVAVFAAPYAIICDQPERRKMTRTMGTGSTFHSRFRYSIDHLLLLPVLRTCKDCLQSMRGSDSSPGKLRTGCRKCLNWDAATALNSNCQAILDMSKLPLPAHYPMHHFGEEEKLRDQYITQDNKILPFQLTSQRLKQSLELVYNNLLGRHWNDKQALAFAKRECFDTKFIQLVTDNSSNARALQAIDNQTSMESRRSQDLIKRDAAANPAQYTRPAHPFSWKTLPDDEDSLGLFVDVLMHLLFLGIVKATLHTGARWMRDQKLFKDFKARAVKLSKILADLKLDWLPVLDYREGTFGGWVSENFLAFSRVMTWFFQEVPDLLSQGEDTTPPSDRPNSAWRKPHYQHWLRVRGQRTKGTVEELKKIVAELLDQPSGPPRERTTVAGEYTPSQVERTLVALEDMIASVMTPTVVPGKTRLDMDLKIKAFLAEFDLLDQQVSVNPNSVQVFSKSNFMCLLNLPALTERFGPLRDLWEGKIQGEGFIQPVKHFMSGGQRQEFECNCLKNILVDNAFCRATEQHMPTSKKVPYASWDTLLAQKGGSFKTYEKRSDLEEHLTFGSALSVVVSFGTSASGEASMAVFAVTQPPKDPRNKVLPEFSKKLALYLLEVSKEPPVQKMGGTYKEWHIDQGPMTSSEVAQVTGDSTASRATFGVLLPLMKVGGLPKHHLVLRSRYSVNIQTAKDH